MLTEEQKKAYVEKGGVICPFCGNDDIVGMTGVETDAGVAQQEIGCNACGKNWFDVYKLETIEMPIEE